MTKTKPKPDTNVTAGNGLLNKNVRFFMTQGLWDSLVKCADAEGRREGRPKSVASVMRRMLEQGVAK